MLKQAFGVVSPAGRQARLSILIFHRVLPKPDILFPDEIDARRFDEICEWLKSWLNVLPLDKAVASLKNGTLPASPACITFDDGYADNHDVAVPVLKRHGLSATFFIATGFLDGGRMWNDSIIESVRLYGRSSLDLTELGLGCHASGTIAEKRAAITTLIGQIKYRPVEERISITEKIAQLCEVRLPHDLMMTSNEVKAMLQAGMQIGAHTVSHPILARAPDNEVREEIQTSKRSLEQLLGERVGLFAYPNGKPGADYKPHHVDVVRSLGFDAAVSTAPGASGGQDDLFQLRRFTPWDRTKLRFFVRMAANLRRR